MILVKGERIVDSIKVNSVGLLDKYEVEHKSTCNPKIVIIAKRSVKEDQTEFLLLTDTPDGVYIELYIFDHNKDRVLSYVSLFQSEKIDRTTCRPFGINRVAAFQTLEIRKDVIVQAINDSFNDIWERRILRNEDGYYEVIWYNHPLRKTKIYSARINDPDGFTNVRKYPSTKSKIIYKILKNEVFQVEELPESKGWYMVFKYNEYYGGWIRKSLVKNVDIE